MRARQFGWIASVASIFSAAPQALAATITWDGGADGTGTNWNEAVNWSGDAVPGTSDAARFSAAGLALNKVVALGGTQVVDRLVFEGYDKAFTIGSPSDVAAGSALVLNHVFRQSNVGGVQTLATDILLATNSIWDVHAGYNSSVTVVRGVHGDGLSLEKNNTGTLVLAGTNTYSGRTTVRMGTLELGFNLGVGPVTNIMNPAPPLEVKGGSVKLSGKASALNSQTVNGLAVRLGSSSFSIVNANSGNKTRLSLGGITRSVGGTVNFVQPTVNTAVSADNGYVTTNANDASGLLGAYATVGAANWAASDGTNIVAYSSYTTPDGDNPLLSDSALQNVRISNASTGAVGLASSFVTANTLLFSDVVPRSLLIGTGNTLRLGALGGILTPSGSGALTIEGGTLSAGGAADVAGELIVQNATAITNTAVIADNGLGPVTLTKSGSGSLVVAAGAMHTGGTFVNAGTLLLAGGVNLLPTNGALTVTGGTLNLGLGVQTNSGEVVFLGGTVTNGMLVKSGADYSGQAGVVAANLAGDVGFEKTSLSTLYLSGTNTYTGDTVVREGTLIAGNGSSATISVRGNLIVGSPSGGAPASVGTSGGKPFNEGKNFTVYNNGSLSFGSAAQYFSGTLTIIGGSFSGSQPYFQSGAKVYMTGGNFGGTIYIANFNITSYPTSTTAVVSANLSQSHVFSVADGEAALDLIYSGGHGGTGKTLTKAGAGVMAMTGSGRTYTGSTVVNAGTLLANNTTNSCTGNSAVSVGGGATLGGVGFIGGVSGYGNANVTVTGSAAGGVTNVAGVAPGSLDPVSGGHVIGTLTVGNLGVQTNNVTFGAYSTLRINVSTNGTCDRLVVNGTLSLATATDCLEIRQAEAGDWAAGTYHLVTFQQLAAEGQTFDTVTGLPERGELVYTATGLDLVVTPPPPKGTVVTVF